MPLLLWGWRGAAVSLSTWLLQGSCVTVSSLCGGTQVSLWVHTDLHSDLCPQQAWGFWGTLGS